LLSAGAIQKILQNLVREQVSVRDLLTIVETLADYAALTKDTDLLTEYVRQRLSRSLVKPYVDKDRTLKVFSVAPQIEELITKGINQTEYGSYLALEPVQAQRIVDGAKKALEKGAASVEQPVMLCSSTARRHLKKLLERFQINVAVLAHNEIPNSLKVHSVGAIGLI